MNHRDRSTDHLARLFEYGEVFTQPKIKIPYICNDRYTYDGGDFHTYPQRCGFDIERIKESDFNGKDIVEVVPFLQAWLSFGILRDVFLVSGIQIVEEDFITQGKSTGQATVSTVTLNDRTWDWIVAESDAVKSSKLARLDHVDETLGLAEQVLEAMVLEERHGGKRSFYTDRARNCIDNFRPGELIIMSTAILGEALSKAKHFVFGDNVWDEGNQLRWDANGVLMDSLVLAGWCPGELSALITTYDSESRVSNLYYLCFQPRDKYGKDHSQCSQNHCLANQVDEREYTTRHTDVCRGCEFLTVEREDALSMSSSLHSGGIPLISVAIASEDKTAKVQLHHSCHSGSQSRWVRAIASKYKEYSRSNAPYIAFSHVWSDGLGNPISNSLP